MAGLIASRDWGATALGPIAAWPASLKTTVNLILASSFPMAILWGRELIQLYNNAFAPMLGATHPKALGTAAAANGCAGVWRGLEPHLASAFAGETIALEDLCLPIPKEGAVKADDAWFDISLGPLTDGEAKVLGVLVAATDKTAQHLATAALEAERARRAALEFALKETQERLRICAEAAGIGTFTIDLETEMAEYSPELSRMLGFPHITRVRIEDALKRIHRDDVAEFSAQYLAGLSGTAAAPMKSDFRYVLPGGEVRWMTWISRVDYRDGEGDPVPYRVCGACVDISEQKLADQALRDSETRFRQFSDASSDVLWMRDAATLRFEFLSHVYETVFGQPSDLAMGLSSPDKWLELVLAEDRDLVRRNLCRVREGEELTFEYRIVRPFDGEVRWIRDTGFPLIDAWGKVQRIGGIGHDCTQEKDAAERMDLMVAELQHRTRNLIAVVRSIANQIMATSKSPEAFISRFEDRLSALSRIQGLLANAAEEPVTLEALIRMEMNGLGAHDGVAERIELDGPPVVLRPSMVQMLSLALHELAINARAFGALADTGGRLRVAWTVHAQKDKERRLVIEWRENGSQAACGNHDANLKGYGRELIEEALPYSLGAKTLFSVGEQGVYCMIDLPLDKPA